MSCFFVQLYNTEIWTLCLALQTLMSKVPVYLESNTEPEPQVLFFFLGGGGQELPQKVPSPWKSWYSGNVALVNLTLFLFLAS